MPIVVLAQPICWCATVHTLAGLMYSAKNDFEMYRTGIAIVLPASHGGLIFVFGSVIVSYKLSFVA